MGPCTSRRPAIVGSARASVVPSEATSVTRTGASAANATRTHSSRSVFGSGNALVSLLESSCIPGATRCCCDASASNEGRGGRGAAAGVDAGGAAEDEAIGTGRDSCVLAPPAHANAAVLSRTLPRRVALGAGETATLRASDRRRLRDRVPVRLDRVHPAAPVELDAPVDEHGRGVDVADQLSRGVDLDGGLGADIPVDGTAADDDDGHVDLRVDLGAVSDDERVVAPDLALEDPVDADAPLERQLPLELCAASEERGDFGRGERLLRGQPSSTSTGTASETIPSGPM